MIRAFESCVALLLAVEIVAACQASPGAPREQATPAGAPTLIGVELQPEDPMPGGQFVWILNGTDQPMALGCWALRSQATGKTLIVERGLRVPPHTVVKLASADAWLGTDDRVQLVDPGKRVVDQTPELRDRESDDQFWFRKVGGEWQFGRTQPSEKVIPGHLSAQAPPGC